MRSRYGRRAFRASPIRCVGERIKATGVPEFREVAWRAWGIGKGVNRKNISILIVLIFELITVRFLNLTGIEHLLILKILSIFVLLFCFVLLHYPSNNKTHAIFRFKTVYIVMVTSVLVLFSTIPSIALYKDSLTFYSQMYSRQSQLEVANTVQKRYSKLDIFAKLFFPSYHNMSDGHTRCTGFNFLDSPTGVYGLSQDELKLSTNLTDTCLPITDYSNPNNSIMDSSLSSLLFQYIAGFHLFLSHQYTAAQDNFNKIGWGFDNNNILTFTTMGISGKLRHTIEPNSLSLSNIFLPFDNPTLSLSWQATVALFTIALLFLFWFYQRVSFIVRNVFGIDIPEIVKNNIVKCDELEFSGQCLVFINGSDNNIKEFCAIKIDSDKKDIVFKNVADIYLNKLVYSYVAEQDQKHYTFYMIPDFIISLVYPPP